MGILSGYKYKYGVLGKPARVPSVITRIPYIVATYRKIAGIATAANSGEPSWAPGPFTELLMTKGRRYYLLIIVGIRFKILIMLLGSSK